MNTAEPCVIVIFGASGDLTSRKLIPALYELHSADMLPAGTTVLGISRTKMTDDGWREELKPHVKEHAQGFRDDAWSAFAQRVHYFSGDATQADTYEPLIRRIEQVSEQGNHRGNVLLYLSVAPALYEPIIERIDQANLITENRRWCSINRDAMPWQRIVVEKPFGTDLKSATSLNRALGRVFEENAIFRIDHYLGKEIVQNLLVMRFANTIFEPLWNHQYIDHVQISATETLGVEDRGSFYDRAGAMRDMIQSHLLQVLALVAMEPPTQMQARHIREEKIKIFDAIAPPLGPLSHHAAFGQYGADAAQGVRAYRDESDVPADSTTDTYAAMRVQFNNWRWSGTPFYVRSGKRLARKLTNIIVQFKQPPTWLFGDADLSSQQRQAMVNRIEIQVAPRPSMTVKFIGKVPGAKLQLDAVGMDFDYSQRFQRDPVEAYGPLLLDAMRGDQTLYPHRLEVEGTWRAVMPFLQDDATELRHDIAGNYRPGSWGPACGDELLSREGREWHNP